MRFLSLDLKGLLLSLIIGTLVLVLGGSQGLFLLVVLVSFLVLSAITTEIGKKRKKHMKVYEKARGWKNVAANGIVPIMLVLVLFLETSFRYGSGSMVVLMYVASVSAITADKFASELGILGGEPRDILTFRRLNMGRSGGVTFLGSGMALVAAFAISLSLLAHGYTVVDVLISGMAGFLGNIIDSVFGHFEEEGIGNKYSSNIFCALFGAIFSLMLIMVV